MNTDKTIAEAIASQYAPKETSKLIALQKLDRKAKAPANVFAFTFGTAMTLILGTGMCLSMKVIGSSMALGIVLGLIGIAGVSCNYAIYKRLREAGKKKYAFEIMELAKEISGEGK